LSESGASEVLEKNQKRINRYYFIVIFIVANAIAFILLPIYVNPYTEEIKSTSGSSYSFPILYVILIVSFAAFFIFMARSKRVSLLKILIYIFTGYALLVIMNLDLSFLNPFVDLIISIIATVLIIYFTYKGSSISLTALGLILGSGVALLLASTFDFYITVIIGAIFSIYDALSVVLIGSMVEMAQTAMDHKMPLLFTYGESDEKIAMGFGDVIIPTFVLFSILINFGLQAYLYSFIFALISFLPINILASKRPQPGLPFLINAIFLGIILFLLFPK